MVKEEEVITEAGGRGYMDMLGLGDEDLFRCLSPSSYFNSSLVSTATTGATPAVASSPTCVSYMDMASPPYHHTLSFTGQDQYHYYVSNGPFGLQYSGGDQAIPVVVPQKSSSTTECSSSIPSSPTATCISAISSTKPQTFKKKGSRCGDQRKAAPAAAATNKKPRVRRERLGERIMALQQLVSPFGKSDTATVLHEALGYIRFLHDQVQVLSSPYMQCLPASTHATVQVKESAAGTVIEPQRSADLRSRGLCLVPISCTDHVAGDGHGNGADIWSVAVPAGVTNVTAAAGIKGAAAMLPGCGHPGHLA